jgi:hypothetical protein
VLSFAIMTAIAVGTALVTARLSAGGFDNLVVVPVGAVAATASLLLGLGAYRSIGAARDKRVAETLRGRDAAVFASGRTRGIREAVRPYRVDGEGESHLTYDFTVSSDADGIVLWDGPAREPVPYARIPWRDLWDLRPGQVHVDQRKSRGLILRLTNGEDLELQPLGEGLLATFPFSAKSLTQLASRLSAIREIHDNA